MIQFPLVFPELTLYSRRLKEEIQGFLPNTTIADGYKVYESILNDYYDEMTTVTTSKPYMVGPGNHESNCDNGGTTDSSKNISYTVSICMPGQTVSLSSFGCPPPSLLPHLGQFTLENKC
jgi:hypothetical protein